ncbi:MAG: hypothetical protein HYU53_04320 [Acidobacteria bacterium]|nr:hypothetical protein [Acidobacteriota bacterium]
MVTQSGVFFFDGRPNASTSGCRRGESGLAMTWDGRLDNREDLLLQIGGTLPGCATDAEITLALVERRGLDAFRDLIGDWSAAVWDERNRCLHLARDYMGARPLYYHAGSDSVSWSSSLGELVERCGFRDALSEAFVARFMSLRPSPEDTPYESVRAVPAATCLSFDARGAIARRRFWSLEPSLIRYADKRAYEEHLRALWRDAVASRLRARGVIWAELSGGLDSSSVVCMADRLIQSGQVGATSIRPVSHATLRSPEGDERRFIAEVERQLGVRSEIVGVEEHQDCRDEAWDWVSPYALHGVGLECVRRVRDGGGREVLSGRMGDAVMGCQPDNGAAVFDDFARWRVRDALANMRAWSRATRKPFVEIAWRLLVAADEDRADPGTGLLTARLKEFTGGSDPFQELLRGIRPAKRALARMVLGYSVGARLDVPVLPPGITYTYPFSHRPLVEFMLAIPGEESSAPGDTRSLMRRAFAGFVPDRVLRRTSKGYYPPAAFRAAREAVASLSRIEDLEVVRRGWIDPARLREAIRALTDGGGATGGEVHSVLRLEKWLQARQHAPANSQRREVKTNEVLNA